jgi:hypothetical protein
MEEASLIDGREGYASWAALQGIVRFAPWHRVGDRQPSIDPHIHLVSVVRHKRPAPASFCALSPDAREAGLLLLGVESA